MNDAVHLDATDTTEPLRQASELLPTLRIDFVSDVSCPWCPIGLIALQQALDRLDGQLQAQIHCQPFELNPQMAAEGENTAEHLHRKYGSTLEQLARNFEAIRARGAALGFTFNRRERIYNTFDAHRLLHWAGLENPARELALKQVLLRAYFTEGLDVSDVAVLAQLAGEAGLEVQRAAAILASDEFAADVREREQHFLSMGVNSVPAVIINQQHLISGGQPVEVFEQALRQIAEIA
ncbi:MAG: DsbA family oxidoreductase [Lysobacteraceae bacterium]